MRFRFLSAFFDRSVYHITKEGWTKIRGNNHFDMHYDYYPLGTQHATAANDVI